MEALYFLSILVCISCSQLPGLDPSGPPVLRASVAGVPIDKNTGNPTAAELQLSHGIGS